MFNVNELGYSLLLIIVFIIIIYILVKIVYWIYESLNPLTYLTSAKKSQVVASDSLGQSSNFTYSVWVYINDWTYRLKQQKILFVRNNNIKVYFSAYNNDLNVEVGSKVSGGTNSGSTPSSVSGNNGTSSMFGTSIGSGTSLGSGGSGTSLGSGGADGNVTASNMSTFLNAFQLDNVNTPSVSNSVSAALNTLNNVKTANTGGIMDIFGGGDYNEPFIPGRSVLREGASGSNPGTTAQPTSELIKIQSEKNQLLIGQLITDLCNQACTSDNKNTYCHFTTCKHIKQQMDSIITENTKDLQSRINNIKPLIKDLPQTEAQTLLTCLPQLFVIFNSMAGPSPATSLSTLTPKCQSILKNTLQTSGLSHMLNTTKPDNQLSTAIVKNIPLQSWVNVVISVYGKTLDIYINGRLATSYILDNIVDLSKSKNNSVSITPKGGFDGWTSKFQYWDSATNADQAYNIYMSGGGTGTSDFEMSSYKIKVSFLDDNREEASFNF